MPVINVDFTKSLPAWTNKVFYEYYCNRSRYLVLYGGAGSGKSVFSAQKHVFRMLAEKNHKFLIVRKVARTMRNSVFAEILEVIEQWGLGKLFNVKKSDMEINCINGNKMVFMGLDDVEKLKSIVGITGIWIEEASETSFEDFQQLDLRLRGHTNNYKQIVLTFNPVSALSWLKRHFFDTVQENTSILKTTYKDNKWLDEEYREVLRNLKDQDHVYYQVYALGEWGVLGNLVYNNWVVDRSVPTEDSEYNTILQGLDFGFNDPSAFIKVGVKDQDLYVYRELYEPGLTNTQLIERVADVAYLPSNIIADSSEPARIKEFRRAKLKVNAANKGKGSVKSGIDWVRRRKIFVHPSCDNFIKEIQGYKYREDKDGNVYEEPVDFNNHLMDALRYAVEGMHTGESFKAVSGLYNRR